MAGELVQILPGAQATREQQHQQLVRPTPQPAISHLAASLPRLSPACRTPPVSRPFTQPRPMGLLLPPPNPPVLSLFSASLWPHPTWTTATDRALPDDSLVLALPSPDPLPAGLVHRSLPGRDIAHRAVHLQSPTPQTTFVRCPPARTDALGVELPWLNLHVAPLGRRELALEFGIRDGQGVEGRVRCATFTVSLPASLPQLVPFPPSVSGVAQRTDGGAGRRARWNEPLPAPDGATTREDVDC